MIEPDSARPTGTEPRRTPWGLIFGAWTGYGLLNVAQEYVSETFSGRHISWWTSLLLMMPLAYTWALATPTIQWLGRRFPFDRHKWPLSAAVHVAACLAFVFLLDLVFAFHHANVLHLTPQLPLVRQAAQLFVWFIFSDGLLYWTIITLSYAADHHRRLREREITASQLRAQLAQAELRALKMQLQPHFLFNALHTIGSLVRTGDRDSAVRMVAGLGDLLRRILDGVAQQEVPLHQELEFVRNYLDIERARFRDRLEVAVEAQPEVLEARVPHLILQPLVENAMRHGIAPYTWAGHLVVDARRLGNRLQVIVRDDGPGIDVSESDAGRPGIGLSNTRARLERLYGVDYLLDVQNAAGGGLEVKLEVPFRLAELVQQAHQ